MKVLLFGATGMVGQGVLRECLLDPDVRLVQTVGRTATSVQNPKLREIVHQDLLHYEAIKSDLSGFDACFFCLGVSSSGMKEADYSRVTYEITMAAAEVLCRLHLRLGRRDRQLRTGTDYVGTNQRSGRKRADALALCRRIHVSAWSH
jgi:putative NADH-flavin reductase